MNKLFILSGLVFLGITSTPQSPETTETESLDVFTSVSLKATWEHDPIAHQPLYYLDCIETEDTGDLDIAYIVYEEIEEPVDLGFDTGEYLPENFDPHTVYVDMSAVPFIEERDEVFFVEKFTALLPEGFNANAAPADFMDVSYMEDDEIDLGFDTSKWLPEGFDPYSRDLDLNTIVFIEEEELDLGFDTSLYLPENFDPYSL